MIHLAIDPTTPHQVQLDTLKKLINNPPANECPVLCGITPGLAREILDAKTITPDRQRNISAANRNQKKNPRGWQRMGRRPVVGCAYSMMMMVVAV